MDQATPLPEYLKLYDARYFTGNGTVSAYDDYAQYRPMLYNWAQMVYRYFRPTAVLDVGAAYGYVVEWFLAYHIPALGVEPSEFARSRARVPLLSGYLPQLTLPATAPFDVVTCTEVLEHIPEALVPASLQALASATSRFLVLLIMLEEFDDGRDPGHICLQSRQWWEDQLDRTGLVRNTAMEAALYRDSYALSIPWTGRFFVRERRQPPGLSL